MPPAAEQSDKQMRAATGGVAAVLTAWAILAWFSLVYGALP